jgi:hypothetical protein
MGPIASQDAVEEKKIPGPHLELNPGYPAHVPWLCRLSCTGNNADNLIRMLLCRINRRLDDPRSHFYPNFLF